MAMSECGQGASNRVRSEDIYLKLLRGEATSKEYVDSIRAEVEQDYGWPAPWWAQIPWWSIWLSGFALGLFAGLVAQ